ncbi:MAG: glycosyl hydrolase 115 family protein [Muribaculaceae bacterium]|nr:glycosyl hydrolase 115 family protein [Muribaculaceae bacterium]
MEKFLAKAVIAASLLISPAGMSAKGSVVIIGDGGMENAMTLRGIPVVVDGRDSEAVRNVARMLGEDLEKVTGEKSPVVHDSVLGSGRKVVIGTVGQSRLIDSLVSEGLVEADSLRGFPERFRIRTVMRGGAPLLVIAGSDRRGTAYGVTTLSREIGVSPWVWWADVPVSRNPDMTVGADYLSAPPSVRYRGIFINDEDWGMLPWAAGALDKDISDIGPRTYEKVCELLLRLKGNMLAPAMHSCTGAFYSHPESKEVADAYGIMITTSHCEPMLFNNAAKSEWDPERDGIWDYGLNRDVILGKFRDRLEEAARYENIYTIGMRGVHDEAMSRQRPVEEKIALLEQVIADQRDLLSSRLGKPAEEIPQIFVPYKETLDLYRAGLRIPDDVMIIWPDDNYGYMKGLPTEAEQSRPGGSGVYYHTSYLGTPHDYLWLCTTPPAFMYDELRKSANHSADRYWLLNVGDIKPAELDTQTFFDMAWDFDAFNHDNVNDYQADMLAQWCGEEYKERFRKILDEYYRLAWIRKPEYMGWEIEWDAPEKSDISATEFSFSNYGDAVKRLNDYSRLAAETASLMASLPDSLQTPIFETLGYPVLASEMMNRRFLYAQLNGELAASGDKEGANYAARLSTEASDSLDALTRKYNALEDGKWRGMMDIPPGFCAKYQNRPVLTLFADAGEREVALTAPRDVCSTLDLRKARPVGGNGSGVRLLEGFGYDGYVLRLGEFGAGSGADCEATLELTGIDTPEVTLQVFHLPYFPAHDGGRCRIGISLDGGEEKVIEFLPEEWSGPWKDAVLRNSALSEVTLHVPQGSASHLLRLRGIDPGMAIQRIVIDKGDFRPGYVGPDNP